MPDKVLIWCFERNMYWKPFKRGYTKHLAEAGLYRLPDAVAICDEANSHGTEEERIINLEEAFSSLQAQFRSEFLRKNLQKTLPKLCGSSDKSCQSLKQLTEKALSKNLEILNIPISKDALKESALIPTPPEEGE